MVQLFYRKGAKKNNKSGLWKVKSKETFSERTAECWGSLIGALLGAKQTAGSQKVLAANNEFGGIMDAESTERLRRVDSHLRALKTNTIKAK